MSTPAAKVRFELSDGRIVTGDPAVVRAFDPGAKPALATPAAPRPAPEAAPAPQRQPTIGGGEAMARSGAEGLFMGAPSNLAGVGGMLAHADQHPGEPVRQPSPEPLRQPAGPPMARAGMGAPTISPGQAGAFNESRRAYQEQTAAGEDQHPAKTLVARFAGSAVPAARIPQMAARAGAGVLARAGVGAANATGDAALGGVQGLLESPGELGGDRSQADAASAAMTGGGASLGLRGAAGLPGALARTGSGAAKLLARVGGAGMKEQNSEALGAFLKDPKLRAAALEGADVDAVSRGMQSDLNLAETVRDAVLAESKVSLKPLKIAPKLEADGITDVMTARADSQQIVGDAGLLVDHMVNEAGRMKGLGRGYNALQRVKKAQAAYEQNLNSAGAPQGAEGVAHVYAALDQFKRELGAARNAAAKGGAGESDQGVADALESQYHNLQQHLLDESIWGPQTVALQDAVNKAWTKAIPALDEFGDRFSSRARTEKSASSQFGERPAVGSEAVSSFVGKAGTAANDDAERALRNYMRESPELMRTLAEWYDVSGVTKEGVKGAEDAIGRVGASLDETLRTSTAARQLADIKGDASGYGLLPSPASLVNMVGKAERFAGRKGLPQLERGMSRTAGVGARLSGAMAAAPGDNKAEAQAPTYSEDVPYSVPSESVEQLAATNPQALGKWARQLATAHSVGGKEKVRAIHSSLIQSDPEYRQMAQGLDGSAQEEE
jgi:hypothetical protein